MHITMVRKPNDPWSDCRKCDEAVERLESMGLMSEIDRVVTMDSNPYGPCEGADLAIRHRITRTPFFLVEHDGEETVYLSVMKLIRTVLQPEEPSTARKRPSLTANQPPSTDSA